MKLLLLLLPLLLLLLGSGKTYCRQPRRLLRVSFGPLIELAGSKVMIEGLRPRIRTM